MAGAVRIELTTRGFGDRCSTCWAIPLKVEKKRNWWAIGDSNPGPTGYEPVALTNWANGPIIKFYRNLQQPRRKTWLLLFQCRHLSIFPGRHQPSIFDVYELNYCVRNGNRWNLIAINTDYVSRWSDQLNDSLVTRGRIELPMPPWEGGVLTAWPTGQFGAPSRTRTGDPLIKSQLLYQLS